MDLIKQLHENVRQEERFLEDVEDRIHEINANLVRTGQQANNLLTSYAKAQGWLEDTAGDVTSNFVDWHKLAKAYYNNTSGNVDDVAWQIARWARK